MRGFSFGLVCFFACFPVPRRCGPSTRTSLKSKEAHSVTRGLSFSPSITRPACSSGAKQKPHQLSPFYNSGTSLAFLPLSFIMTGSSVCPCSSCFALTHHVVLESNSLRPQQHQQQQPEEPRKKVYGLGNLLGRLRRTRSIESMASDLVGLKGAAQPVAIGEDGK